MNEPTRRHPPRRDPMPDMIAAIRRFAVSAGMNFAPSPRRVAAFRRYLEDARRQPVPVHRCYECDRPEDEFADCKVCNPELRD